VSQLELCTPEAERLQRLYGLGSSPRQPHYYMVKSEMPEIRAQSSPAVSSLLVDGA